MDVRDKLYIGGAWVSPTSTAILEVTDANSEEVMGSVPAGTAEDIDKACQAAANAFGEWSATPNDQRSKILSLVAEELDRRSDELARIVSREVGMPLGLSRIVQIGGAVASFADMAKQISEFVWEEEVGNSLVIHEPIGVVGAIIPWNYPLLIASWKVAPALAAGCTVVLKPSEVAPLTEFILAEILEEAGLPPGAFNVVTGTGPTAGEALASHPKVDMVSFTGSTRAGKRVMQLASETVKKVALELGGKSANVILDDANLDAAIPSGVFACYLNSGQTCSALTRMIVPRSRLAEVEERVKAEAEGYTPGDPFDRATKLGPLVSEVQRDRVRGYIEKGIAEGAKLLTGGPGQPEGLDRGYFIQPTVFSEVTKDMTIAQDEIFGPVLCILPYDGEEEAVEIANDSIYGLAGSVWAGDKDRAEKVARKLRTGQVDINGGAYNPVAPFGGYKQSGIGRQQGKFGLEEYLEIKAMQR